MLTVVHTCTYAKRKYLQNMALVLFTQSYSLRNKSLYISMVLPNISYNGDAFFGSNSIFYSNKIERNVINSEDLV